MVRQAANERGRCEGPGTGGPPTPISLPAAGHGPFRLFPWPLADEEGVSFAENGSKSSALTSTPGRVGSFENRIVLLPFTD